MLSSSHYKGLREYLGSETKETSSNSRDLCPSPPPPSVPRLFWRFRESNKTRLCHLRGLIWDSNESINVKEAWKHRGQRNTSITGTRPSLSSQQIPSSQSFLRTRAPAGLCFQRRMMVNQADIWNLSFDKAPSVLCSSFSPITFPFFIYVITLRLGLLEIITLGAFKIPVHQRKHQPCSRGSAYGGKEVESDMSKGYVANFQNKTQLLRKLNLPEQFTSWMFRLVSYAALLPLKAFQQTFAEVNWTPQTLSFLTRAGMSLSCQS